MDDTNNEIIDSLCQKLALAQQQRAILLASLVEMEEMFSRRVDGRIGPDDAAERWDRARAAIAAVSAKQ